MESYPLDDPRLPLFTAVGIAINEWTQIEICLGTLFGICLRAPDTRQQAASVCFSRFEEPLQAEWNRLHNRLLSKSKKRNAIVHGYVTQTVIVDEAGRRDGPAYLQPFPGSWMVGSIKREARHTQNGLPLPSKTGVDTPSD